MGVFKTMVGKRQNVRDILNRHPNSGFGSCTNSKDTHTSVDVPHRELLAPVNKIPNMTSELRNALVKHHIHPKVERQLKHLGYRMSEKFPTENTTQKGNLAEVFLAEYITSCTSTSLPVYRLRYNTNINQSMKGDDVLAFDFNTDPVRILVGEAKFRTTPNKQTVIDIVKALLKFHTKRIPTSLSFIGEHLYAEGKDDLGLKVLECQRDISQGTLNVQYVGLLLSNASASKHINSHTTDNLHDLVMISLGVPNPNDLVRDCYHNIGKGP